MEVFITLLNERMNFLRHSFTRMYRVNVLKVNMIIGLINVMKYKIGGISPVRRIARKRCMW